MFYGLDGHKKLVGREIGTPELGGCEQVICTIAPATMRHGCILAETVLPPYGGGTAVAHHTQTTELFYVAGGMVVVQLEGQVITACQGDLVEAQPDVLLKLWNPTAEPARVLVVRCAG
jgi:mannose-6-phosphate isomerase-like protein (cupin superfamily)